MEMTRREFLGSSVGALTVLRRPLSSPASAPLPDPPTWLVWPVPRQCSLLESAQGYGAALPRPWIAWRRPSLLVVPAALTIPLDLMEHIADSLRHGSTVIIESGGGFAGHLNFRQHRRSLRQYLQLDVQAPVDFWAAGEPRIPYVDYTWPHAAKVRDFSRVVPIGDHDGEVIAWAGDRPVGLKRQVERGTLIYLGSPLGPALWAGDAEARRWLTAVSARTRA